MTRFRGVGPNRACEARSVLPDVGLDLHDTSDSTVGGVIAGSRTSRAPRRRARP